MNSAENVLANELLWPIIAMALIFFFSNESRCQDECESFLHVICSIKGSFCLTLLCIDWIVKDGFIFIEGIDSLHLFGGQLEIIDIGIIDNSTLGVRFGQGHKVPLQTPANQDLRGVFVVSVANVEEDLVFEPFASGEWAVGFDDDLLGLAVLDNLALLEVGVQLDLVDCRQGATELLNLLQMSDAKVRDTDRSRESGFQESFECGPHDLASLRARGGRMDEEEVEVPKSCPLDRLPEGGKGGIHVLLHGTQNLARDKELLADESERFIGCPDGLSHLRFVFIVLS